MFRKTLLRLKSNVHHAETLGYNLRATVTALLRKIEQLYKFGKRGPPGASMA
jgi:hypothetical protein